MKTTILLAIVLLFFYSGNAQIIYTIAGNGIAAYTGDGGMATAARLSYPHGICIDDRGIKYIGDQINNVIRKIDTTGIITTIAGSASLGYSGDGGPATAALLSGPMSIVADHLGNIYIVDVNNNCIRKINSAGIISTFAGIGGSGYSGDGGPATSATLNSPTGLAIDKIGNIYISEIRNHTIRKVDTAGIITTVAGRGYSGYSGDGGTATAATLNTPWAVAVDTLYNVYIADYNNHVVRKVDTAGIITTFAGNGGIGYFGDGGMATAARFKNPSGLAVDAAGLLYIADGYTGTIRKIDATGIITTIAGTGSTGFSGDGGPATAARLSMTDQLAFDATGKLYLCDYSTHRIRVIECPVPSTGVITGTDTICIGFTSVLADTATGGVWASSDSTVAIIDSTGNVTAVATGSCTISYSVTNSCRTSAAIHSIVVMPYSFCTTAIGSSIKSPFSHVAITPNPTTGNYNVTLPAPLFEDGLVTVTNILGKTIDQFPVTTGTRNVNCTLQLPGVYFINLVTLHHNWYGRIVVY